MATSPLNRSLPGSAPSLTAVKVSVISKVQLATDRSLSHDDFFAILTLPPI